MKKFIKKVILIGAAIVMAVNLVPSLASCSKFSDKIPIISTTDLFKPETTVKETEVETTEHVTTEQTTTEDVTETVETINTKEVSAQALYSAFAEKLSYNNITIIGYSENIDGSYTQSFSEIINNTTSCLSFRNPDGSSGESKYAYIENDKYWMVSLNGDNSYKMCGQQYYDGCYGYHLIIVKSLVESYADDGAYSCTTEKQNVQTAFGNQIKETTVFEYSRNDEWAIFRVESLNGRISEVVYKYSVGSFTVLSGKMTYIYGVDVINMPDFSSVPDKTPVSY